MDIFELKRFVTLTLVKQLAKKNIYYIPAAASGRHIHLSSDDIQILFGRDYQLKALRELSQPDQFACEEQVTLVGPKGTLEHVRILGPERGKTQVEVSLTDTYKLGIEPFVRMSGNTNATPGCRIVGPKGEVDVREGVIVAARHLHISDEDAVLFGLKNGEIVSAKKSGERETTFGNILVRSGNGHSLELHLDTDEANAAGIQGADILELIRN